MCVGCGACVAASPGLKLELHPEKRMLSPNGAGNSQARDVCPGYQVDFDGLLAELFPGAEQTPLGAIDSVFLAQSTDHSRNLRASSGGLIKELLHSYLAQPEVSGVISIKHAQGLEYRPALITDPAEIDELPGSVYHALDLSGVIEILAANPGRYVLTAIPCQLEGIFQYILRHAPELRERIHTTIGLICGWTYTHHALEAICRFSGVPFDELQDVSYRGGGPVGPLRLVTRHGITRVNRRVSFNYQVAFDRSFNLPRCHLCINHTNYLADVVVGDAWLPSTLRTRTGISLVICRRPETRQHLERLAEQGRIRLTPARPEDIEESQTRRVAYGDFAYAYAEFRRERGLFTPRMQAPNRVAARLRPLPEVEQFHAGTEAKVRLQRQGRYRALRLRKLSVEFLPFTSRYLRWFLVRVLRIKSLLGLRKEVPGEELADFR